MTYCVISSLSIPKWVAEFSKEIAAELTQANHILLTTLPIGLNGYMREAVKEGGGHESFVISLSPMHELLTCDFAIVFLKPSSRALKTLKESKLPTFNLFDCTTQVNAKDRWSLFKQELELC